MRARTPSPRWSEADDAIFRELWSQGLSLAEIAERFGRSENAVTQRRLILDLPTRRRPKVEDQSQDKRKEGKRPRRKVVMSASLLMPNRKRYFNSSAVLHALFDAMAA